MRKWWKKVGKTLERKNTMFTHQNDRFWGLKTAKVGFVQQKLRFGDLIRKNSISTTILCETKTLSPQNTGGNLRVNCDAFVSGRYALKDFGLWALSHLLCKIRK